MITPLKSRNQSYWVTLEDIDTDSTDLSISPRSNVGLDDFWFESVLGSGQHGQVLLISLKSDPSELFALKVLEK